MQAGVLILTQGKNFSTPLCYRSPSDHWGNVKNTDFVDKMICKVLRDLPLSLIQPLISVDDCYIRIFRYVIKLMNM